MAIEENEYGSIMITGLRDTHLYRLLTIKKGLEIEIKSNGKMKMTRGVKMTTVLRREYDIRGNRQKQLIQLNRMIDQYAAARAAGAPEDKIIHLPQYPNVGGSYGGEKTSGDSS